MDERTYYVNVVIFTSVTVGQAGGSNLVSHQAPLSIVA